MASTPTTNAMENAPQSPRKSRPRKLYSNVIADAAAITEAAADTCDSPRNAKQIDQTQTSARTNPLRPSVMLTALENPARESTVSVGRSSGGVTCHPQAAKCTRSITRIGSRANAMGEDI